MIFVKILICILPWQFKRKLLEFAFGYSIHPTAHIGFAWIYPKKLVMKANSKIAHLSVAVHLDSIELGEYSSIGRNNWITGYPTGPAQKHFNHQTDRKSELKIGKHSAITKNHHLDCTNRIYIGDFTTIAGYNSQFLTHSINLFDCRQDSSAITIGDFSFIGTNVVVLGGSMLPSYSILGAKSLLNKSYSQEWTLYAGVSAVPMKEVSKDSKYFNRSQGFVF